MCAFGLPASSWSWNGGLPKWLLSSSAGDDGGSGVRVRHRLRQAVEAVEFAVPHCLAAAICRMRACTDTVTAGSAMRSLSLKSAMVFTFGLV
jgi:hypothetical protein